MNATGKTNWRWLVAQPTLLIYRRNSVGHTKTA